MAKKNTAQATIPATEAPATAPTPVEGRTTRMIDCSVLCIPGLTRDSVNSDPYYDPERLKLPISADNVTKLASCGDTKSAGLPPISCVQVGEEIIVVDGRRRTREALEAAALRGSPVMVECFVGESKGTDAEKFLAVRRANSHRLNDSPLALAVECQRAKRDFDIPLTRFASELGIAEHSMRMNMCLLKLDIRLQKLLDSGEITPTFAIQLSKVSDDGDAQVQAYEELKAKNMATVAGVKAKLAEEAKAPATPNANTAETVADTKAAEEKAPEKVTPPRKTEVALTLSQMRKLVASSKVEGFPCPIEEEVLRALRVLVGELPPEQGPKGLALAMEALAAGTLPQPQTVKVAATKENTAKQVA